VAQQHGAPGADVIEQLIAIRIIQMLTLAALDDERLTAYGAEGADGTIDAAHEQFFGALEDFARASALPL
jgi:hypothetical protein